MNVYLFLRKGLIHSTYVKTERLHKILTQETTDPSPVERSIISISDDGSKVPYVTHQRSKTSGGTQPTNTPSWATHHPVLVQLSPLKEGRHVAVAPCPAVDVVEELKRSVLRRQAISGGKLPTEPLGLSVVRVQLVLSTLDVGLAPPGLGPGPTLTDTTVQTVVSTQGSRTVRTVTVV